MSRVTWATAVLGAACLALLTLEGCSAGLPDASAPPPPPPMASAPPPAAAPVQPAPAPEPPAAGPPAFTAMAPIANPDQMSKDERHRVYGDRYDHPSQLKAHRLGRRGHPAHPSVAAPGVVAKPPVPGSTAAAAAPAAPASAPTVIPAPAAPDNQVDLNWMTVPGAPYLDLPVLGHVASKYVTAAVLLLLAVLLLAIAAVSGHSAGRRRGTRRAAVTAPSATAARASVPPRAPVRERADSALAPFPHNTGDADETVRVREPEPV